eukprot:TRINITY_DN4405_c0_g5_i1.p1 TRINITY_DN4405_c0_g5~~TRINITY_DN4405_c0_g5_i1.p1  ORF type:complete len:369 (+),score=86.37 TRINITY_DN4405_c0_g5_i1:46-1107(+)
MGCGSSTSNVQTRVVKSSQQHLIPPNAYRVLGNSNAKVSPIGLGCMGMSAFYSTPTEEDSIDTLNAAIDMGCTLWDTADIYNDNELLLAKVLKARRKEVFLCTKFSLVLQDGQMVVRGDREYVHQACEKSLKRLGVDYIDLYYQHRVDPKTPIEETVGAMAELVKQGKVRYLGLSESNAATIRRAHAVHPIAAYQVEYSPWTLDIEHNDILKTCRELNIAIVAYSPLGRGFLSGRLRSPEDLGKDDWRRTNPRFQGENFQKNLRIVDALQSIAQKKGATTSQLCLAWVMAQGKDFIPIPGTTKRANLQENLAAVSVTISDEENKQIRAAIAELGVSGTRYPESFMASVNANSI